MKQSHFLILLFAILVACSGTPTEHATQAVAASVERTVEEVPVAGVAPTTLADLSIDGMSCEMMCGGSIKKALAKLPGVHSTEIRFVEGDERDHAVVDFDAAQVSDAQMIEAIQKLHDGQYKVVAVKITKQIPTAGSGKASAAKEDEPQRVSVLNPADLVVPGILAVIAHVLRL